MAQPGEHQTAGVRQCPNPQCRSLVFVVTRTSRLVLKDRLTALGKTVVIPQELLTAADELRILGNDAAHVEAKAYDAIGSSEATAAIELAKELLKAVYQYSSLLDKTEGVEKAWTVKKC
jgi:hypothetical protein